MEPTQKTRGSSLSRYAHLNKHMLEVFEFAAILSCALFAGAALYINVAEHPARMQCGTELAATVFGPSYKRAAVMQVALALVAAISAMASWSINGFSFSFTFLVRAISRRGIPIPPSSPL